MRGTNIGGNAEEGQKEYWDRIEGAWKRERVTSRRDVIGELTERR